MHDCKGREIKVGDFIRARSYHTGGQPTLLKVIGTNPGATSCNVFAGDFDPRFGAPVLTANETLVVFSDGQIVGSETDVPVSPTRS